MRFLVMLVCPTLLSCSVWLDLDKSKLGGYQDATGDGPAEVADDMEGDADADAPMDSPGETPDDVSIEDPCPGERECSGDLECDDGDVCTTDTCETTCGICSHEAMTGLTVGMEDYRIRITEHSTSSTVKIALAGSLYGATWAEAPASDTSNGEIWFATFTEDGAELSPMRLTDNSVPDREPAIAWSGSEFGISWYQGGTSRMTRFERIGTDGFQGGIVDVISGVTDLSLHDMVWDGATYGLTWTETNAGRQQVWFARLQPDGSFYISPNQITTLATASTPSLTWTGSEYGVAWIDGRHPTSGWDESDIYFQRIATTGEEVLSSDLQVTTASLRSELPDLVWSGSEYAVAWHDYRDGASPEIYFARITGDGLKNGVDERITDEPGTFSTSPSIAHGDGHYGLAYNSNGALIFYLLDEVGVVIGERLQVNSGEDVWIGPDLLWNGEAGHVYYGVGWQTETLGIEMFNFVKMCSGE